MIEVDEARSIILEHARPRPPAPTPRDEALGRVLAESVAGDLDSPPYDKSLMDGYAVRCADLADGAAELEVIDQIHAGAVPARELAPGTAAQIMTGAPIPPGADAVVVVERSRAIDGGRRVRLEDPEAAPGQNILPRGSVYRRGETLLPAGRLLRPPDIGLLADTGVPAVAVYPRPRAAVVPTGDELAGPDERPGPGRIRNTNGPMLRAAAIAAGAEAVELPAAADHEPSLRALIRKGLEFDVLLLSGGVSAGDRDLTPRALAAEGVREVFHRVRLKPGKPLWFGLASGGEKLVFGLPGNPVSSFVCFELFVRPALERMSGRSPAPLAPSAAALEREYAHHSDRPTYAPAQWRMADGRPVVAPLPWRGSADLKSLADANCLAYFPAGHRRYAAGELVPIRPF